ncbi:hypothetical protein Bca4012_100716 [Brassica carinata]
MCSCSDSGKLMGVVDSFSVNSNSALILWKTVSCAALRTSKRGMAVATHAELLAAEGTSVMKGAKTSHMKQAKSDQNSKSIILRNPGYRTSKIETSSVLWSNVLALDLNYDLHISHLLGPGIQETRGYNGGGCGYSKCGVGGGTVEVAVDNGVEVVVIMDTKVVVDTEVDTSGNFVDETSLTNLIHTISSMELC